jgi:hypothetical protein
MKYRITAVADSEGDLSPLLEEWWTNGGALLWNQYGGLAANSIVLDEEDWNHFLLKAQAIHGWRSQPERIDGINDYGPLTVASCAEPEAMTEAAEFNSERSTVESDSECQIRCCGHCGRYVSDGLAHLWNEDSIAVPKIALNHMINSLLESISYAKGQGPNNYRTWQAALDEFMEALSQRPTGAPDRERSSFSGPR